MMNEMKSQADLRRKLLKTAAVGSGVLAASGLTKDKWLTPVIDAVVLPAHAQTSRIGRYSMLNPDYPIHSQAQTGVSAQLASVVATQSRPSLSDTLLSLLIPTASAASVPPSIQPLSSTARLEMYLEYIQADNYRYVFLMTAIESGLSLVLFGDGPLKIGSNTIELALCKGDPKPFPVVLESVSEASASILIAGESFSLAIDPSATPPARKECS